MFYNYMCAQEKSLKNLNFFELIFFKCQVNVIYYKGSKKPFVPHVTAYQLKTKNVFLHQQSLFTYSTHSLLIFMEKLFLYANFWPNIKIS